MIYPHPDGTYHRYPFTPGAGCKPEPVPGRPHWYRIGSGSPLYVEPPRPVEPAPQNPHAAGMP